MENCDLTTDFLLAHNPEPENVVPENMPCSPNRDIHSLTPPTATDTRIPYLSAIRD